MKSSIGPLNSYIKVSLSVNGSISTGSCAKVHEIADFLNRLNLNLQLTMITPMIWALGGTSANSHGLSLCIYPQTSIGAVVSLLADKFLYFRIV